MTTSDILPLLKGVRRSGAGWVARCPAHDDHSPSLSISEKGGRPLLYCHAGCSYLEIRSHLFPSRNGSGFGLSMPYSERNHDGSRNFGNGNGIKKHEKGISALYDYTDPKGSLLYQVVRYEETYADGSRGKSFACRRPKSEHEPTSPGDWIYRVKGTSLVLYNQLAVTTADIVYVVEGEKDVDALRKLDIVATCNPFGAGKWRKEFNDTLRGKNVIIIPDNDEPGHNHAEQVAHSLNGIANQIVILALPDLPEKGDVTDFINSGGTADDLMDLVSRAEDWKRQQHVSNILSTSKLVFTPLTTLLAEPPDNKSFIWESTLPSGGFSICSAKPKVGKSTFARNLAIAIASGKMFLGRETRQGKVLYLCLEEKRSEIRRHFENMNVATDEILIYTGTTPKDVFAQLAAAISEIQPLLVIIDPLSRVIRVDDFNDYGSMARGLEPLIDLARQSGTHIMALHHDSKMERNGGDALLGSTAIFGAVDCHMQLKKRDASRTISTTQRYGNDIAETVIQLDPITGIVTALGEIKGLEEQDIKAAIMACVTGDGTLTEAEIKGHIEKYSRGAISKAIRKLVDENVLIKSGDGVRGRAFNYGRSSYS